MAQIIKNPPAMQKTQVRFLSHEDPLQKGSYPTPVFLPLGHKEGDMTEQLTLKRLRTEPPGM